MNWIRNWKIRTKIFSMLGLSILFLFAIGTIGTTFMQSMGNNARAIYEKQMIPNGLINKLLFGNSQIDLYQTELLVAVDPNLIMQIQEQITETRASNQATRKELEQIELSQRAQAEYQKQEAGEAFRNILYSVQAVSGQIQEVSAASEEMSASSQQVAASLHNMKSIAQVSFSNTESVAAASEEQLATLEEISSAVGSLTKMSQDLFDITQRFKS
ncbi:MCP four helix bundle domain-containing protein [Cohnella sp. LGH]|uniref:MCP four helix bundle domain-containing protein n=1 Tax=Cohnella sp. LGH TaxID=1619153 RepID=UPI001ADBFED2|nr:MCP four helix bundle domain-containing protein [Cohnella sp. LGH]QTH42968.1 MCP four helix bundle domain-containing protein [Cohnella sp. LGH]